MPLPKSLQDWVILKQTEGHKQMLVRCTQGGVEQFVPEIVPIWCIHGMEHETIMIMPGTRQICFVYLKIQFWESMMTHLTVSAVTSMGKTLSRTMVETKVYLAKACTSNMRRVLLRG